MTEVIITAASVIIAAVLGAIISNLWGRKVLFYTRTQICPMCGKKATLKLSVEEYEAILKYEERVGTDSIQDALPFLDAFEREFLKTGYCPDCQETIFFNEYSNPSHRWVEETEDKYGLKSKYLF